MSYISFFNSQKLISYVININLSSTNTLINVNSIKGNPKFFILQECLVCKKIKKPDNLKPLLQYYELY